MEPKDYPEILRWFESSHLSAAQREIVLEFEAAAYRTFELTAPGDEQSTALRKLLEAKDAAVRASLLLNTEPTTPKYQSGDLPADYKPVIGDGWQPQLGGPWYTWDGGSWIQNENGDAPGYEFPVEVVATDGYFYGAQAQTNWRPVIGDKWQTDPNSEITYYWNGENWINVEAFEEFLEIRESGRVTDDRNAEEVAAQANHDEVVTYEDIVADQARRIEGEPLDDPLAGKTDIDATTDTITEEN